MSKAVYKNAKSQKIMLNLYDKQTLALNIEFEDIPDLGKLICLKQVTQRENQFYYFTEETVLHHTI